MIALDGDTLTSKEAIQRMREQSAPIVRPRGRPPKLGRKIAKKSENSTPYDNATSEYEEETTDEE